MNSYKHEAQEGGQGAPPQARMMASQMEAGGDSIGWGCEKSQDPGWIPSTQQRGPCLFLQDKGLKQWILCSAPIWLCDESQGNKAWPGSYPKNWDWREDSAVMSQRLKEMGFSAQHPHGSLQPSVTPVPGDSVPSFDLPQQHECMWYPYIHINSKYSSPLSYLHGP